MSMPDADGAPLDVADIDVSTPSPARIYDYWLGGSHNFAADREVGRRAAEAMPTLPAAIRANRAFLRRVVHHLVTEQGIDQFLDLGSGVPTVGNVHEVAQAANPDAKVVYVDIEPVAVAHGRRMLADNDRATVIRADLRQPDDVLARPELADVLDLTRPVAVLMIAVLHFMPDTDQPGDIVASYRDRITPGSYIALSHAADDNDLPTEQASMVEEYQKSTTVPFVHRDPDVLAGWLHGMELVPPGIVLTNEWRPDTDPEAILRTYGVLARKVE
jgi:hypothetical protein